MPGASVVYGGEAFSTSQRGHGNAYGADAQEEMAYHGIFFLSGMTATVRLWLQNGCREESAALYDLLRRQAAVQEAMTGW